MTKREKKYQRRLFAEMHLGKKEQQSIIDGKINFFTLYKEWECVREGIGFVPSWVTGVFFAKTARRMMKLNSSVQKFSEALQMTAESTKRCLEELS